MREGIHLKTIFKLLVVCSLLAGSFVLVSATRPVWTAEDKAFYADPNLLAFVRPGLDIKILSAEIAADGTIRARVKFTDPRGMPLDREGILTPGPISASFIAAYIPRGQGQYVAYTTRIQRSPITGQSAVQAAADTGGRWEKVGDGEYIYTFGTRAPSNIDRSATHTIGVYANRNLTEFDLGINLKEVTYNFVPDGSPVREVRDVIRTATCNKCHHSLSAHGTTGRTTMEGCVLCHTPQTIDPDTGNTVDMAVMTHKIHRGRYLPSVRAGGKYQIIGFAQTVFDFSKASFSPAPFNTDTSKQCETCHESNRGAAQADHWLTKPNRAACGSCHDNVNFATGENHAGLPQVSDRQCAFCHIPEGELEFDLSIKGAHTTPEFSKELPGVVFEILEIRDGVAGRAPTVTFTLKDKKGNPLAPASFNSLSLVMGGPTSDYSTYITQSALAATGSGDRWTITFARPIPADAKGTWAMGIEGRRLITLLPGTQRQRSVQDAGKNVVVNFSVDGSRVEPRRTVVELADCNQCHNSLTIHGFNRNQIEHCVICHNPVTTDVARRPADRMPAESVDMRAMIHRIHAGSHLSRDYTVYGFGNVPHNYNEVHYPGFLERCSACHVAGSYQLPLRPNLLKVVDPRGYLNPVGPETIACISCHDSIQAASHALANTSALGESCAACHGPNREFSVDRSHAR